jgi:hypothetical protein
MPITVKDAEKILKRFGVQFAPDLFVLAHIYFNSASSPDTIIVKH